MVIGAIFFAVATLVGLKVMLVHANNSVIMFVYLSHRDSLVLSTYLKDVDEALQRLPYSIWSLILCSYLTAASFEAFIECASAAIVAAVGG